MTALYIFMDIFRYGQPLKKCPDIQKCTQTKPPAVFARGWFDGFILQSGSSGNRRPCPVRSAHHMVCRPLGDELDVAKKTVLLEACQEVPRSGLDGHRSVIHCLVEGEAGLHQDIGHLRDEEVYLHGVAVPAAKMPYLEDPVLLEVEALVLHLPAAPSRTAQPKTVCFRR